MAGNALVGQSGGPTAVINQTLIGVVERALAAPDIARVFGAINGIQGVIDGRHSGGLEGPLHVTVLRYVTLRATFVQASAQLVELGNGHAGVLHH